MTNKGQTRPSGTRSGTDGVENAGGFARTRIPSLDGFRGVGIVIVLLVHAFDSPGLPFPNDLMYHAYFVGWLILGIFFCVSGYLISGILLDERAARKTISLRNFYVRRGLRIFPVYYTYLAVVMVLGAVGVFNIPWQQSAQALTYTRDFFVGPALAFGITWSLAIEEQFYLAWPPILALLTNRRAIKGLLILLLFAPLIRYGIFQWFERADMDQIDLIWRLPQAVMDFMILGCLLALVEREFPDFRLFELLDRWNGALVATILVVIAYQLPGSYDTTFGVGAWILPSVSAVWAVLVVQRYMYRPQLPLGRVLNWSPVVRLGHLSYSLYLWHILFVNPYSNSIVNRFPISIAIAFAVAWVSREYVEKPFLRIKTRFQPTTAPAKDQSDTTRKRKDTIPSNVPSS